MLSSLSQSEVETLALDRFLFELERQVMRKPAVFINLFGAVGEGKTNTATHIAQFLSEIHGFEIFYAVPEADRDFTIDDALYAFDEVKRSKAPRAVLIYDDASFIFMNALDPKLRIFENRLARVRHIIKGIERIVVIFIYHYLKSIVPFLRGADIAILHSIKAEWEKKLYSDFFDYRYIEAFAEIYRDWVFSGESDFKPVLVRSLNRDYIVYIPLVENLDLRSLQIVMPHAKCEDANISNNKKALRILRRFASKARKERRGHSILYKFDKDTRIWVSRKDAEALGID